MFAILIIEFFGGWRLAYLILGLSILPVVALMKKLDFPDASIEEKVVSFDKVGEILTNPLTLGVLFGIFFNVGKMGTNWIEIFFFLLK
ncbi:hypothetical protein AKJ65_04330 [candidate division MSBL1 archaeon SCGC-AAA259E19]|uniref:Major facilitator superfamily (MFS) profile domain-containing protein n=1 Tax=candidate division MSBL1 archaeon SCGC-AAA259E19 TaxID=1698264 RepID=A0A133UJV3_9EURY|nr:hypothetical protein AKJ65_04330 [candidate division MSBL1 archaeon SCGC-AAA259E19]